MKACARAVAVAIFSVFFLVSCNKVPLTGRNQLNLISDSQLQSMAFSQYDQFMHTHKLSTDKVGAQRVARVGQRLQDAVQRYMASQGLAGEIKGYAWSFSLVQSSEVNAWAMPGGKVVVYEGILPVTQDDEGLAVVLGHEIAHVIAKHGNERMSQALMAQLGGVALSVALSKQPEETKALLSQAYGLGAQYGAILPFSRLHENEADRLGMMFMAMAGYNPRVAVDFWTRMAAKSKGGSVPEFLSTHPSDATRIAKIKENLPEAMKYLK